MFMSILKTHKFFEKLNYYAFLSKCFWSLSAIGVAIKGTSTRFANIVVNTRVKRWVKATKMFSLYFSNSF